jgi:uncharacterized protein (TIGR00251 family)
VQPSATRDELAGIVDGHIKARIIAPPIDGKANAHLRRFLAKLFRAPQSDVELISAERNRNKSILVRCPRQLPAAILRP